jgi:hypothetical protein
LDYSAFIDTIVNSSPGDWEYDDELGKYIYLPDIRLTIVIERPVEGRRFEENWVTVYADHSAWVHTHHLRFCGDTIELFDAVAVDGFRMVIPYPNIDDLTISRKQYRIGSILNGHNTGYDYDNYLERAGITVRRS